VKNPKRGYDSDYNKKRKEEQYPRGDKKKAHEPTMFNWEEDPPRTAGSLRRERPGWGRNWSDL